METTQQKTATVVKVLVDAKVVISPSYYMMRHGSQEDLARSMEDWAKELNSFFRDHRSQDVNGVSVERFYERQCSSCHREFEAMEGEDELKGKTQCASCGAVIEATS